MRFAQADKGFRQLPERRAALWEGGEVVEGVFVDQGAYHLLSGLCSVLTHIVAYHTGGVKRGMMVVWRGGGACGCEEGGETAG